MWLVYVLRPGVCCVVYGNNNEAGRTDAGEMEVFACLFLSPTAHVTRVAAFLHHMVFSTARDVFFSSTC